MPDPFHQTILEGLAGELDPRVFEDCACDLLREVYPGLVPIRGGQDAGMDGAIADGEGEGYPFIATTDKDVARNLKGSLDSYKRAGKERRRAVLATSRSVTPQYRRKLEKEAQKKDFVLVNIHDRYDLANRLYRNPHWCRELLGLDGQPSALSSVPRSRSIGVEIEPIGRSEELAWLRATSADDRVIVGQPGSGKTFLLEQLVREGWGLFLVDDDPTAIANALREQEPRIVVVDDAHRDPSILETLRHLREEEVGGPFTIVASTWPGEEDEIIETLVANPDDVLRLELLTREEILEVIKASGVHGPNELLRELVDQSANKPGLAVFLAELVKRGAWQELVDGTAVTRKLTTALGRIADTDTRTVLACFALGGDGGVKKETVARFLARTLLDIRRLTIDLAASGVLSTSRTRSLVVIPRALRWALVRDTFFRDDGTDLDYRSLLDGVDDRVAAVLTLIEVAARCGSVPHADLRELITDVPTEILRRSRVWGNYAGLDRAAGRWTLENYPGDVLEIARATLLSEPERTIKRVLASAADPRPALDTLGSSADPLAVLCEWVRELPEVGFSSDENLERRRLVACSAKEFLDSEGRVDVGIEALCLAFDPLLERTSVDPGIGRTMTMRWALLPAEVLPTLIALWHEVRPAIRAIDEESWPSLSKLLWDWSHLRVIARSAISPRAEKQAHRFAEIVLRSLEPLAKGHSGAIVALSKAASDLEISLTHEPDPTFELFYDDSENGLELEIVSDPRREAALEALADRWASRAPDDVARELKQLEGQWRIAGTHRSRAPHFCGLLAKRVETPEAWFDAFSAACLPDTLLGPFLAVGLDQDRRKWQQKVATLLAADRHTFVAVDQVLRLDDPPTELLDLALKHVSGYPRLVWLLAIRDELSPTVLRALLAQRETKTSLPAAVGLWEARRGEIPGDLRGKWCRAILGVPPDAERQTGLRSMALTLGVILRSDSELSFAYLQRQLQEDGAFGLHEPFQGALGSLNREQRLALVSEMKDSQSTGLWIRRLVGDDLEIFRAVLARAELARHHLAPLAERLSEESLPLIETALESAKPPAVIAAVIVTGLPELPVGPPIVGSGIEHWNRRHKAFGKLLEHSDPGVRAVGREGQRLVDERISHSRAEQRNIELHGLEAAL